MPWSEVKTSTWSHIRHSMTGVPLVSDLVFVVAAVAFFALAALVVKGVERL